MAKKTQVYSLGLGRTYYIDYPEYIDTISGHCLACAKITVMHRYGYRVDIRGWQKQGVCGDFLKACALAHDNPEIVEEVLGEG